MATLKQSTTYSRMFLLVQSSDHVTGLTGATASVSLSKAGGSFASAGGTVTEVANGWYKIALTTTDTATLGDLAFHITATSADPTDFVDQVTANILGDTLPADVSKINGVATSSVTTVSANIGTTQPVNFTGTGASALAQSDVTDWKGAAAPAMTGDAYARLGAPVGASISADIAGVPTTVWANVIETGYTAVQTMRLMAAVLLGKSSGLGSSAPVYRDVNDSKARVSGTLDGSKNRTAVTLDAT